jgi:hypothetical protein
MASAVMDRVASPAHSDSDSDSGSGSGSESEQEYAMKIFRTDGYWYYDAYIVLLKFACLIRKTAVAHGLPQLPTDVCGIIGRFNWDNDVFGIQRLGLARKASDYILLTLQNRMAELQARHPTCVYSPDDPYMNVINYFTALQGYEFVNGLLKANDKYLLTSILPWLGLTDWGSNSGSRGGKHGGRTIQMETFKSKLKQFLKQMQPSAPPRANLKRSAPPSSAEESAAAVPASALPASALPASAQELRVVRAKHFGFELSEGDKGGSKRLNSRKLRRKRKFSKKTHKQR